jgi:formate hydrogenlyase subunit 6/NADH:ubiquinone oxidoreductase subunit I
MTIYKRKCSECGLCEKNCPMNIKLMDYKKQGKRILSTECILCCTCIDVCPEKAIHMTFKYDHGNKEYLDYNEGKVIEKGKNENK